MSRIGKQFIIIPEKVQVQVDGQRIIVKGPKGSLSRILPSLVCCTFDEVNKKLFLESTIGTRKIVVPNTNPFTFISRLSKEAVSASGSPHYLFFENKNGYHFRTIQQLFNQPKKAEFNVGEEGLGEKLDKVTALEIEQALPPETYKRAIAYSLNIKKDLILANITLKYTQSNSVCYALNGQTIGIGAGQQSRIDCIKIARKKAELFLLRSHPTVKNLVFRKEVKHQQRINAIYQYLENDMSEIEYNNWVALFEIPPPPFLENPQDYLKNINDYHLCHI